VFGIFKSPECKAYLARTLIVRYRYLKLTGPLQTLLGNRGGGLMMITRARYALHSGDLKIPNTYDHQQPQNNRHPMGVPKNNLSVYT